jgi:hypothetical protein
VEIAEMKNPKTFECPWQTCRYDLVHPKLDARGIATSAAVEPREPQYVPDHRMDRVPILQMEEVQALAKDLGFMVLFYAKALPGMNAAQALVQPLADVDHRDSPRSSAENGKVHLWLYWLTGQFRHRPSAIRSTGKGALICINSNWREFRSFARARR